MSPTMNIMKDLVKYHKKLDEPMTGAIWIKQSEPSAWLIEIMPDLPDDTKVLSPIVFSPASNFRYALYLIAGNVNSLSKAISRNKKMAQEIVKGKILYKSQDTHILIEAAKKALKLNIV